MKLTLCAMGLIATSVGHFIASNGEETDLPSDMQALFSETISASNYTTAEQTFCVVTPTVEAVTYQAYYSTDKNNWKEHGTTFTGNGSFRVLEFNATPSAHAEQIHVRLKVVNN